MSRSAIESVKLEKTTERARCSTAKRRNSASSSAERKRRGTSARSFGKRPICDMSARVNEAERGTSRSPRSFSNDGVSVGFAGWARRFGRFEICSSVRSSSVISGELGGCSASGSSAAPSASALSGSGGGGGSGATLRALPWRGIGVVRPSILRAPPSRGAAPTAPAQFLSAAS